MFILLLLISVAMIITGIVLMTKKKKLPGRILISIFTIPLILIADLFATLLIALSIDKILPIIAVWSFSFSLYLFIITFVWNFKKTFKIIVSSLLAITLCLGSWIGGYEIYEKNLPTVAEPEVLEEYNPTSSKVIDIDTNFEITSDFPKLDGATALYPIYISIAKSIYPEETIVNLDKEACVTATKDAIFTMDTSGLNEKYPECVRTWNEDLVTCSKTKEAYRKIVDGEADIIFVAGPSKAQEEYAKEKGVELVYTPIGKEAFVFFVNSKNKLNNISVEQIQDIYSGKTTKWNELGIKYLGDIRAFQRAEGSGSQTALQNIMAEKTLMTPPQEDIVELMGGIINKTADYKNYKNAIGFSFRFYSTEMVKNDKIKLLSLNGIAPTLENIENGEYPITSEFFAVTRKDASPNTLKIIDWLQTEEAQSIIKKVGYTPIFK